MPNDAEGGPEPIRVLIVDDHEMFIEGISRLLETALDIEVTGAAATMAEAVELAEALQPHVAIVDIQLPDGNGSDVAIAIRQVSTATQILIISGSTDEAVILAAVEAGCSGVLTKDKAFAELTDAIRLTAAGESYVDPHVVAAVRPRPSPAAPGLGDRLTPREREILQLLGRGHSNQAIGTELYVSNNTVRNHVQRILQKLDVHSKLEAVFAARRDGLLDDLP